MKGDRPHMGTPRENVEARAAGRPPEEAQSDDPGEQAEVILEDSEERIRDVAERSKTERIVGESACDG
jgi:hypothetical protein